MDQSARRRRRRRRRSNPTTADTNTSSNGAPPNPLHSLHAVVVVGLPVCVCELDGSGWEFCEL